MNMLTAYKDKDKNPFFGDEFRQVIEDHLGLIASNGSIVEVSPVNQYRFNGNFYGLLAEIELVPYEMYWITMRCNQFVNPVDYREGKDSIVIPNIEIVYSIFNTFNTRRKK